MFRIRNSRTRNSRTRLLTAAATGTLALLSLTACGDGSGVRDEGSSAKPAAASRSADSPADSPSAEGAKPAPHGAKGGGKEPAEKTGAAGKAVTCESGTTKTTAAPLSRPVNHLLLTVTNTGSSTCHLYGYPAVNFGDAQSVPPVIEESQPQAVVTLAPGEAGYASVNLSSTDGSGQGGRTAKSLAVFLQDRDGEFASASARPTLPDAGVYVDDSLKVTYWQQSLDDAVSW